MSAQTSQRMVAFVCAVTLAAAACGSTSEAVTTASPQRPTSAPTTSEPPPRFEVTSNLVYHQGDDRFTGAAGLMDVVAPVAKGPWPTVVAYHGDPSSVGRPWMLPMAEDLADEGRVVFVPDWGHTEYAWQREVSLVEQFDLLVREVRCAVVFAKAHAADFGGDPDHITVYGYSAGGNAALMAGLADTEPLEACAEAGPSVVPQAVVSGDGDVLLGAGIWDSRLADEPEAFYGFTPWRFVDGSPRVPVQIVAVENTYGPFERSVGEDPYTSMVADRHTDIDLVGELLAMGLLDDGAFSVRDSNEWAYQELLDAGYDVEWVLLPDSNHLSISPEGRTLLIDTILQAERQ